MQLKAHVTSTQAPPLALEETANAPVDAIADDEATVELAEVEPADEDDIAADDEPFPAELLEAIPLEPDGLVDPLTVEVTSPPPTPPPPTPGSVSTSSLP